MTTSQRFKKVVQILAHPGFAAPFLKHRVAAAVEHMPAIRLSKAGTLVDIGANKGQFSVVFRAARPEATIVAFEPLPDAADIYEEVFNKDTLATLHRIAISDVDAEMEFFVADRRDSSSLLRPGDGQAAAFGVRSEATRVVPVRRLDEYVQPDQLPHPILMKIDVQGAELQVLKGFKRLEEIELVYVELSFVELYEGQPLFYDVAVYLQSRGFELAGVFNQVSTSRFGPTQADFLFRRSKLHKEG